MTIGLTTSGLIRPNVDEIRQDIVQRYQAQYGLNIRTDSQSEFGHEIDLLSGLFDSLWQRIEEVFASGDPRQAIGAALDAICAETGTQRKGATYSLGTEYLTGDASTTLSIGDGVSTQDDLSRFTLTSGATLSLASVRLASFPVGTGQVRSNSGNCYYALVGGTTGPGPGPSGTTPFPDTEFDGSVTWSFLGEGLAYASAAMQATATGPVAAPAGTVTKITTPHTGWKGACNVEDVRIGSNIEDSEVLRVRRVAELHGLSGGGTAVNAVRASLLKLAGIGEAFVFENVEHDPSPDGIPGHAVEAVVTGSASAADIGQALLDNTAAGIKTYGMSSVVVNDSRGFAHTMGYTVAADVDVYLVITVSALRSKWPSDGSNRVSTLVLAYGQTLPVGWDVEPSEIIAAVIGDPKAPNIPGTIAVGVQLGLAPNPTGTTAIPISLRQRARLDSTRVAVVVNFRSP